jgi:carbon starvation protein CstA
MERKLFHYYFTMNQVFADTTRDAKKRHVRFILTDALDASKVAFRDGRAVSEGLVKSPPFPGI